MGRFDEVKTCINSNIKENGKQEITGQKMNSVLIEMVDATDVQLTGLESKVAKKQESISDLEEIRTGASKGATALQSVPEGYVTKEDIKGFATKEDLEDKQDVLKDGENIKTINGESILGSGNIAIKGGGASGGVGVAQLMTEVTYDELVALRDSASLVPGMYYRITDYETETSSANTMSAHHPFDIVVMALSKDTLSEDARAMQSERDIDGYFANSNLGAWELKYCLDNDLNRFSWAKDIATYLYADLLALGVGILQAKLNGLIVLQGVTYIRWDLTYSGITLYLLTTNENPSEGDVVFVYSSDTEEIFEGGLVVKTETTTEKGKGVVYRLKDDNNNDVSYDFKNILFTRKLKDGQYDENDGIDSFVYTFNYNNGNANEDQSILFSLCRENKIFSTSSLPDNVFLSVSPICYGNILGGDSSQNTFLDSAEFITLDRCYRNVFGNGCSYIELGGGCSDNIFGDGCSCISFASNCYGNILEKGCLFISLGHRCDTNTIGESCNSCIFGANCGENVLGSYCLSNSFGDSCEKNVFGSSCSYNTFGDLCRNNVFGSSCSYNTFGNVCQHHVLGNRCDDIVFGENCYGNTIGAKNVDSYYKNIRLKNDVSFIALVNSEVAAWNSVVKNYTIGEIAGEDSSSIIEIEVFRNRIGETCVSKNSNGEIKQWNPADLVQ